MVFHFERPNNQLLFYAPAHCSSEDLKVIGSSSHALAWILLKLLLDSLQNAFGAIISTQARTGLAGGRTRLGVPRHRFESHFTADHEQIHHLSVTDTTIYQKNVFHK